MPALLLVTPLMRDSLSPDSEASGWALLASLPLAVSFFFTGLPPVAARGSVPLLVVFLVALFFREWAGDGFEADRALCLLYAAGLAFAGGACLDKGGRRWIARGAALVSLAWMAGALVDGLIDPARGFVGVLGNSGDTSEAALPGALAGIVLATDRREHPAWRVLGLLAALDYAVYVGTIPVWAGAAGVFAVTAGALVLALVRRAPLARAGALALVSLVLGSALALRPLFTASSAPREPGQVDAAADFGSRGGFAVRRLVWQRVPALVAEHPWFGVGAGQFAREFPPHRDPAEIELSTQHHRTPSPIEVEHPHNDWLQALAEHGLLGGGALLVFFATMAVLALRALASEEADWAACGAAALGVLANACFNGPLLENAASATLAFACFGALAARPASAPPDWSRAVFFLPAAIATIFLAPRALALARHGRALAELASVPTVLVDGRVQQRAEDVAPIVERALAARDDSVVALSKKSQLLRAMQSDPAERIAVWERVLELRPHRFEALIGLANEHARGGEFARARYFFERARALDAADPNLARNLVQLALDEGDGAELAREISRAASLGALDVEWLSHVSARALFDGRLDLAAALLLAMNGVELPRTGEKAQALSTAMSEAGHALLAEGLQCAAQQLWARSHAEQGRAHDAVRSYRQALRLSAARIERGGRSLRLEFAAALALDGALEDARAELAGWVPSTHELAALPGWASDALAANGLAPMTDTDADGNRPGEDG